MQNPRPHGPDWWEYPETRTYLPPTFADRRPPRSRQPAIVVVVALVAAAFGAYLLDRAADVRPGTHTDSKDVAAAVHEQLHKMFLADLPPGSRVIRSGIVSAEAPERINYPQGVLALRCYGDGHLGVSRIMMDGTKKKHADINCGRTALTLVASDATVRTILITPEGAGTWASWALAYSSSAPSA